jgi:hypothetical protein
LLNKHSSVYNVIFEETGDLLPRKLAKGWKSLQDIQSPVLVARLRKLFMKAMKQMIAPLMIHCSEDLSRKKVNP